MRTANSSSCPWYSVTPLTSLTLTLQSRTPSGARQTVREQWLPERTAIIVCDMWDLHHCKNAVTREGEMAPRMNEVLEKARGSGVLIIHAPSSCMKSYEGTPARERAKSAPQAARLPDKIAEWCKQIPAEERAVYPIDQADGGEQQAGGRRRRAGRLAVGIDRCHRVVSSCSRCRSRRLH